MKLWTKTLLIVTITLVVLVVVLNTISRQVLLAGFSHIEREDMERNVRRVLEAFNETVDNLSIKAADWAKWDDTYRYVDDWNREYIESNLTDESLAELRLNLMLLFDAGGQMAYGRYCDLETGLGMPVAHGDLAAVTSDSLLMHHDSIGSVAAGVKRLPGGPMYMVSRPILTSTGAGPIGGTLIFGRYIDSAEVRRIGQVTHLKLAVEDWAEVPRNGAIARAVAAFGTGVPVFIEPHNTDTMAGFARINDLAGEPLLLVHVDIPRDIYRQGRVTVRYLIVSIIIVGMLFGAVILVLLRRNVLSRVAKLSGDVRSIAAKGDHGARVSLDGKDELTALGMSVNSMLASLERVEGEVRRRSREMRMIMSTVPAGLLSIDEQFRINPEYSASVERILGAKDLAGRDFFEAVGFAGEQDERAGLFREYLELLLREPLSERDMAALNPFEELQLTREGGGTGTWVRLRFYLIRREAGAARHLLVVLEDITESKALSERILASESENVRLRAIAEDPGMFRDFLAETNAGIERIRELLGAMASSADCGALVNDIFREAHTVKGAADVFRLGEAGAVAAELEDAMSELRAAPEITPGQLRAAGETVDALQVAVRKAEAEVREVLGDDHGEIADCHLRVPLEKLKDAGRAILDRLDVAGLREETARLLRREVCLHLRELREVPARRALARALKLVPVLFAKFEKNIGFELEGADVPVDYDIARELVGPLIHLLRNAADHGIEFPEERSAAGKAERGTVRVQIGRSDDEIRLEVSDDGRGLDPVVLRKTAVARGLISDADATLLPDEEAMHLIFRPGFTTTETATDISGRGVGMDAVAVSVGRLRGSITIDSGAGRGTTFRICVPCNEC